MSILQNSNAISAGGYDINNSLRFRQSATAYLSRTFTTPTNNKIGTISLWRKRGSPGTYDTIYGTVSTTTGNGPYIQFNTDNLRFVDNSSDLVSSQVFRDYSAWYHIVVAIDTTQATASNRVKIYVNGSQITAFSSATYGALNYNSDILSSGSQYIGYSQPSNARGAEGYLAEVNFIDGQALTPSSFGETDTTTGVWKPKAYSGTYGTNGFYLKFSDIATTSGSNAGLGKDFSGNSNYWTTNNISVTSGTTYDAMTDVPTLTSATVANYCTANPLDKVSADSTSNGNLLVTVNGGATSGVRCNTINFTNLSGKWYWEGTVTNSGSGRTMFSMKAEPCNISSGVSSLAWYWRADGVTNLTSPGTFTTNDVIMFAYDSDTGKMWVGKNGTWSNSGVPASGTGQVITLTSLTAYALALSCDTSGAGTGAVAFNYGQQPFAYTPPTGFNRVNTYNLPDSTIKKGNSYMDATLYTGNGTSGKIVTNSAGFKPDFVWIKDRSAPLSHGLFDSVRGAGYYLISNSAAAQSSFDAQSLQSFNSNGFTVGSTGDYNSNNNPLVAWQWQAGQGTTSSNTSGSITSTVSVNTTAGFSIVTYTGTGANATVGHGLGVAPKMIILKGRSTTFDWMVYHTSLGNTNYLRFNQTNASAASISAFNNTSPTSTVFSLGDGSLGNQASATQVAYCWAEIAGFSKFGSYTGNGSADGPFVYCGFRPRFVLVKCSSAAGGSWVMYDTSRNQYNLSAAKLAANLSEAENGATVGGSTLGIDVLANGFKHRNDGGANHNASGATYIFAAFAENPFKNSLAR